MLHECCDNYAFFPSQSSNKWTGTKVVAWIAAVYGPHFQFYHPASPWDQYRRNTPMNIGAASCTRGVPASAPARSAAGCWFHDGVPSLLSAPGCKPNGEHLVLNDAELNKHPGDLNTKLLRIWTRVDGSVVETCVTSMPARLDSVIANNGVNKGGHTSFWSCLQSVTTK